MLKGDDSQTHFYTSFMSHRNELLLVCIKLRLAMPHEDLSYRFRIAASSVSKIFHRWIDVMPRELHRLICWPDRTNFDKHCQTASSLCILMLLV